MISLFALLLLAAQAQAQKEALAVLVVGVDNWMFGDVLAHMVGEELKRSNPNLVPVTRERFVQDKLKALRRATGKIYLCELREWASKQDLSQVCLVEAQGGSAGVAFSFKHSAQSYSAHLIEVSGGATSRSANFTFTHAGAPQKMSSAELNKVAWEVVGRLQSSSSKAISYANCYSPGPDDLVEMVFVEGGTFAMGCLDGRDTKSGGKCSGPPTQVTVSDFWIGKYEVTQKEWAAVMGGTFVDWLKENVTLAIIFSGIGSNYPAYYVSYNDALAFIAALNARTGKEYRMPTEAEWEYAARGGALSNGYEYSGSDTVDNVAWYAGNSGYTSHEVGKKAGNELGIYDMSGNVAEWCSLYGSSGAGVSPTAVGGGDYYDDKDFCRVAHRFTNEPSAANHPLIGFRVVLP
jgi:formylglycine-generating enzyme required for sulfatase activity